MQCLQIDGVGNDAREEDGQVVPEFRPQARLTSIEPQLRGILDRAWRGLCSGPKLSLVRIF